MGDYGERQVRYRHSVEKALNWLAAQQGPDNTFGLPDEEGVNSTCVTPLTYLWGGMPWRCAGVIERIRSFIGQDGSLRRPALDSRISDRTQYPYALSWVVRSTAACGAVDIAHRSVRHLLPLQHEESGGLFGIPDEAEAGEGIIDMASTGMGGLAFLATGLFSRAHRVGDYILSWLENQPGPQERLLPQWHTEQGLLDEESGKDLPPNLNAPLVITRESPHTSYWLNGILVAFLTELYQVTGEEPFLEGACEIFDFAERSPLLGYLCLSHKFAWGAASLYSVTRDRRHLEAACLIVDRLIAAQRPEGFFVYEDLFPAGMTPPHPVSVGVTSQFAAWTAHVTMHLPTQ